MNLDAILDLARRGSLYPSVILHGGTLVSRRDAALRLARILLCEAGAAERPCGSCRHCRRVVWPGEGDDAFHPDFLVLERDLKTSTSVGATRDLLRAAHLAPFEARGQVFVIASAETLSGEAGDALLKALEEPGAGAPRNFFLLAPSQYDLLPTLRSRSLVVYLGPAAALDGAMLAPVEEAVASAVAAWAAGGGPAFLLAVAEALLGAAEAAGESWSDPRASRAWSVAAAALVRTTAGSTDPSGTGSGAPAHLRRPLLDLAAALLEAPPWRLRGVPAERLMEGLVFRHLEAIPGSK